MSIVTSRKRRIIHLEEMLIILLAVLLFLSGCKEADIRPKPDHGDDHVYQAAITTPTCEKLGLFSGRMAL